MKKALLIPIVLILVIAEIFLFFFCTGVIGTKYYENTKVPVYKGNEVSLEEQNGSINYLYETNSKDFDKYRALLIQKGWTPTSTENTSHNNSTFKIHTYVKDNVSLIVVRTFRYYPTKIDWISITWKYINTGS